MIRPINYQPDRKQADSRKDLFLKEPETNKTTPGKYDQYFTASKPVIIFCGINTKSVSHPLQRFPAAAAKPAISS